MNKKDYSGSCFGRLEVLERVDNNKIVYYKCRCVCGNFCVIRYTSLKGKTKSCGCIRRETGQARGLPYVITRTSDIGRYYRRNAKTRNLVWALTNEETRNLINSACHYCGFNSAPIGIVRIDNTIGYTRNNSVPCCRFCNFGKHTSTFDEFKDWIKRAYEHLFHC